MKTAIFLAAACTAMAAPLAAEADATPAAAPVRHLVYAFTYNSQGDMESHGTNGYASDTRSGAGDTRDYKGSVVDRGTITVDVLHEQPDKGLVVRISEQGEESRKADPATCVVYGSTSFICDPNATVNSEEYTLLRFLGSTFVDPAQLDEKQHWKIDESNDQVSTVADYTIKSNANGMMTIDEARVVKQHGAGTQTTDISAKIGYDYSHLIPITVDEYVTQRQAGMGQQMTTTITTTLKLSSDSMNKN
jgi:hypothetical protein